LTPESVPMVRVRGGTGANRAVASGRLRADRLGARAVVGGLGGRKANMIVFVFVFLLV